MRAVRRLLWGIAMLAVVAFVVALVPLYRGASYTYALTAVTVLLWTLWLVSVAHSFTSAPPVLDRRAPLTVRVKVRAKRALLWLLAIVMTLLLGLVVVVSARALGMILRG